MPNADPPRPGRVVAIVPVGALAGAKSRLGAVLDAEERLELTLHLARTTIAACVATPEIAETIVVTPDDTIRRLAEELGARPLRQRDGGLNRGIDAGRDDALAGGATAVLILPIDLPDVAPAAIEEILSTLAPSASPARRDRPRSTRARHERPAPRPARRDRHVLRRRQPGRACRRGSGGRRGARGARRAAGPRHRHPGRPAARRGEPPPGRCRLRARVEAIALDGIPEVVAGDDLGRLIGDALERTPGVLPLRPDDVVVVTQKIVSKAEGAIVDLTTVEPRPDAVTFAERWDRDPRQIEVVLREARRVVRMEHGVLITETPHGFVCANGGVDASNVGPDSGSIVTLLPRDPDASARALRAAIRERFAVDVPVIVSDSFGRPWRWGITDVAIGVSGPRPDRGPSGHGRRRWAGHAIDDPGVRRRDRLGGGARAREGRRSSRCGRPRRPPAARRGLDRGRAHAVGVRPLPLGLGQPGRSCRRCLERSRPDETPRGELGPRRSDRLGNSNAGPDAAAPVEGADRLEVGRPHLASRPASVRRGRRARARGEPCRSWRTRAEYRRAPT